MSERAVAATDLVLGLEAIGLAILVARSARSRWWTLLFAAIATAALCGAIVHGTAESATAVGDVAWIVTLLAIGIVAVAAAMLAARLVGRRAARRTIVAVWMGVGGYLAAIALGARSFRLALLMYVPALLALVVAVARRRGAPGARAVLAALAMSAAAAVVQVTAIVVPHVTLAPNALYHLIQAVALLLLARGARALDLEGRTHAQST